MIGTSLGTQGGIASVVKVYRDAGLLGKFGIKYLATHCDGSKASKIATVLHAWLMFAGMVLTGRVGILHAHVASRASFWRKALFIVPAIVFRVPVILHLHGAEFAQFYEQECGTQRQRLVRWIFERSRYVVVLSNTWRHWVNGIVSNPNVIAIYNPVIVPVQGANWAVKKPGAVLCLGRLGKRKGSFDLVDALAGVPEDGTALELRLGGDGAIEEVKRYAAERNLGDSVQLLGWVNGDLKQRELDSAWIYALPSYNEGLPMSVLEAMAAGLPVVATPVGGIPEAIRDGVEGYLVPPGDTAALSNRLRLLARDDALARQMGNAARSRIESTFSVQAVLPRLEQLYQELGYSPR